MRSARAYFALAFLLTTGQLSAGTYLSSTQTGVDPFIIIHSPGFTGLNGPVITVPICLDPSAADLASSLDWAIRTWNERLARLNNCSGPHSACIVADALPCTVANGCTCAQVPFPPDRFPCLPWIFNAGDTLLHELGHCAFGLGHNNWLNTSGAATSFTNTKSATNMNDGSDNIKGSKDDTPDPNPGSDSVHWFRVDDNDPFVVAPATVMSNDTFSRSRFDLPIGSNWAASANIHVAALLSAGVTQSIMTGMSFPNADYIGLASDEINNVNYAFAGLDEDAADTSDDYVVELVLEPSCNTAVIKVISADISNENLAICETEKSALPIPGETTSHFQLIPKPIYSHILITVDSDLGSTSQTWRYVILVDSFESGGGVWWDSIVP